MRLELTVKYQADDNAAYIRLSGGDILESSEVATNVVFDYDVDGRIVGIEFLNARAQLSAEPPCSRVAESENLDVTCYVLPMASTPEKVNPRTPAAAAAPVICSR
jgi:uncharacterized protein YuzE